MFVTNLNLWFYVKMWEYESDTSLSWRFHSVVQWGVRSNCISILYNISDNPFLKKYRESWS